MRETTNANIVLQFPTATRSKRELSCSVHPPSSPPLPDQTQKWQKKHRFIGLMLENYSSLFVLWQPPGAAAAEPILTAWGQTGFTVLIKPQLAQNLSQKRHQVRKNCDHLWTSLLSTLCQQRSKSSGCLKTDRARGTKEPQRLSEPLPRTELGPHTSSHWLQGSSDRNFNGQNKQKVAMPEFQRSAAAACC